LWGVKFIATDCAFSKLLLLDACCCLLLAGCDGWEKVKTQTSKQASNNNDIKVERTFLWYAIRMIKAEARQKGENLVLLLFMTMTTTTLKK